MYFAEFTFYDFLGRTSMRSDCFKQLYLPNLYVYSFSYDFLLQLLLYPIPDKPLMGRPRPLLNLDRDELVRNGSSSLTVVSLRFLRNISILNIQERFFQLSWVPPNILLGVSYNLTIRGYRKPWIVLGTLASQPLARNIPVPEKTKCTYCDKLGFLAGWSPDALPQQLLWHC